MSPSLLKPYKCTVTRGRIGKYRDAYLFIDGDVIGTRVYLFIDGDVTITHYSRHGVHV